MVNVTPSRALNDTTLPTAIEDSFSFTLKFVSTSVLIVIIILTLLGNSLVIGAFVAFRKLRNVTNYFVASLAVTDILVAVFSMPLWAAYLLTGMVVKFRLVLYSVTTRLVRVQQRKEFSIPFTHLTFHCVHRFTSSSIIFE